MRNKRTSKGITLIALVITIIVLLILAGVSIAMLTGKNGIITQAQNAKNKTAEAEAKEKVDLEDQNALIDNIVKNENNNIKEYHNGVPIPKGFYYVGGEKDTGLVISDKENDDMENSKKGNQFVWVPFTGTENEFKRYEGFFKGSTQSTLSFCSEPFADGYTKEQGEYNKMKQSVLTNDGFYVARFEAGKEEPETVVSKKGAIVWNNIPWGTSMTDIGTEGAVYKSQQMYSNIEKYGVTSTLIYGTQWDIIMNWIDPEYSSGNCNVDTSFVANSTSKGNYDEDENKNNWKGSITVCGASEDYKEKNIYDLAGNVREWTMEAIEVTDNTFSRVFRGGDAYGNGNTDPASRRYFKDALDENGVIGFRVALYIK